MLRFLSVVRDIVIYFGISLIRQLFRPCIKRSRYDRPEAFLVKPQYNCLNNILTYFGVDDIGYINTINLGFDDDKYTTPELSKIFEDVHPSTRLQLQLYHHVATGNQNIDFKEKEVLEIGCGRGGGTSFIAKSLKPKQLTGVDLSPEGIAYCKEKWTDQKNLRFLIGDSQDLPFPDASFDIVLNVESSHCYPLFEKFLTEVSRVLKDGGNFCYCDVTIPTTVATLRGFLPHLGLKIVEEELILPQVLSSLKKMSVGRSEALKQFPFFLRSSLANTLGQPGSVTHNNLQSKEWVYVRWLCERSNRG